jgi:predicted nucleic acid-binding protein
MNDGRFGLHVLEGATASSPLLADSSLWGWRHRFDANLHDAWVSALQRRAVATCDQVRLELLYSARNAVEFTQLDVYESLAASGGSHHRRVKHPDLLIAAAAEAAGWPLVHYDGDFDAIASLTGQACVAVAPLGTL